MGVMAAGEKGGQAEGDPEGPEQAPMTKSILDQVDSHRRPSAVKRIWEAKWLFEDSSGFETAKRIFGSLKGI